MRKWKSDTADIYLHNLRRLSTFLLDTKPDIEQILDTSDLLVSDFHTHNNLI